MTATEQRSTVAPSRRRARRTEGRRGGGGAAKALSAVAGLLLVGGAVGMQTLHLSDSEFSDPLVYSGAKGEAVDARRFSVKLESVAVAKSIKSSTKTVETDHLFLVVDVAAKSSLKPYHLKEPVLVTGDGKKFDATDRVDNSLTLSRKWVQPDIWTRGRFFFEVPASALAGASVRFRLPGASSVLVEPYRPEAEIDLGLDEDAARKLAASPQAVYSTDKK